MSNVKLTRKGLLGIKTETEQNTAATLAAASDYFGAAYDIQPRRIIEQIERDHHRPTIGQNPNRPGQQYGEIEFRVELKGSGTAGTVYDPLGAILKAAGFVENVETSPNHIHYAPISSAPANFHSPARSATVEAYKDGRLHKLRGALCAALSFNIQAGQIIGVNATMRGIIVNEADAGFPANLEFNDTQAPVAGNAFSFDSENLIVETFELDFAPEVVLRPSIAQSDGLFGFALVARNPTATMNPEARALSGSGSHDVFARLRAGTQMAMSYQVGATAGNIIRIDCPKVQYQEQAYGDREGIMTDDMTLRIVEDEGDDDIEIFFDLPS